MVIFFYHGRLVHFKRIFSMIRLDNESLDDDLELRRLTHDSSTTCPNKSYEWHSFFFLFLLFPAPLIYFYGLFFTFTIYFYFIYSFSKYDFVFIFLILFIFRIVSFPFISLGYFSIIRLKYN